MAKFNVNLSSDGSSAYAPKITNSVSFTLSAGVQQNFTLSGGAKFIMVVPDPGVKAWFSNNSIVTPSPTGASGQQAAVVGSRVFYTEEINFFLKTNVNAEVNIEVWEA